MPEPYQDTAKEVAARQHAQKQLVAAYRRIPAEVIADLKRKFGFDVWEADSEHLTDNQIARRVCMKGPIFHIEKMRGMTFPTEKKPKRARTSHEAENISGAGNPG